ncbi:MAG: RagB/SusD family nutrient uptake outer membrane protein, partial [Draconibacterium sp.]|nr:RagB/SusD family nutrient uptake outer membrane protein [Draconibacterium sp.]
KILSITIILFLFIASCNEDEFLKEMPKDDIFAENLYLNYDGFMNGTIGLMDRVRRETTNDNEPHSLIWKIGVDNAFSSNANGSTRPFNDYDILNSDFGEMQSAFSWLYQVVNSANMIINRAEGDVDWQGGSDEAALKNKNFVVGTARLIRAWAYRHLTNTWGDVPLSLEEINGSNYRSDWERTPVSEVHVQMEADWLFARDNLELVEETGFPNSAVASHYLAELYLLQGEFAKSATEAKRVINSDEYHLMTERFGQHEADPGVPFMDLFYNDSREDGNMEVLWTFNNAHESVVGSRDGGEKNMWINYSSKAKSLKKLNADIFYKYNGGRGRGRAMISDSALDWYEETDDRFSEYAIKKYYIFPTDETETEFEIIEETKIKYKDDDDLEDNYLWPWSRKWEYVDPTILANADKPYSWESEMYIRLADTYLLLAEALHKDGDNAGSADYLNEIRVRSNATPIASTDVNIEFILKERSRELLTEEHRRYTLNRNNVLVEWAEMYNPRIEAIGTDIFEHNNLLPLPQGIIDANTGAVMSQNPGYH